MSFCQDLLNLELQSKHVPQFRRIRSGLKSRSLDLHRLIPPRRATREDAIIRNPTVE